MKIFINDIPVYLVKPEKAKEAGFYSLIIDGQTDAINPKKFMDDVWIQNASPDKVDELLQLMTDKKFKSVDSITFTTEDKKDLVKYIKSRFKVVEAAGGVVDKGGRTLLIFRNGKWDLPKGKLEKDELIDECAVREVEEETGVKVEIVDKINHTWHTYMRNNKYVLKKTHWYEMKCLDDEQIGPQLEEGIDLAQWKTLTQVRSCLHESYRSIRAVMQDYHRLLKSKGTLQLKG